MSARPGDIFKTSDKPRVDIAPCAPHVRAHAIVLFSAGDNVIRQRALAEIKRLAKEADDNGAAEVLQEFNDLQIDLGDRSFDGPSDRKTINNTGVLTRRS